MTALAGRVAAYGRTEAARAAVLAAAAAGLVVAFAPPGGDSAAHLYRTMLIRDGVHLWDNFWYGGQYPLASYSLLYYVPAAIVGNVPLVAAAAVVSAALFAAIAVREWGGAARWPARAFGVLAAGPLYTGTYSYALGLAATLAALRSLQAGRPWLALGCAALALGFSPLAFVFLAIALAAVLVVRRPHARRTLPLAAGLAVLAALELVTIGVVFPSEGRYPFSPVSLGAVVGVSALGAALALRSERGQLLAAFLALWALVGVGAFLVPSPFGDNLTRLRALVFPIVLLAAALARFRPRWLAGAALAAALVYNLGPDISALPKRAADRPTAQAAFWAPALAFLSSRSTPEYRVEVVPTFGHWEAYWVPRGGFALARGWYRQLDLARNMLLYRDPLSPGGYEAWLRRLGVRFVLLPDARLGPMGADREAALLRSGRTSLVEVHRTRDWRIYELPGARPILTGPAPARITTLGHDRIAGWTAAKGTYTLRIRYMPYWQVQRGALCLEPGSGGMTRVRAAHGGPFVLGLDESSALVRSLTRRRGCPHGA